MITNTGNVPLTGVTLTDSIYDLADAARTRCQTSLAVGASYTCNYGGVVIDESGTVHNIATVGSDQTDDKDTDDADGQCLDTSRPSTIDKSNNAPIVAADARRVTRSPTSSTIRSTGCCANGIIKDVIPAGLTYVDNSATHSDDLYPTDGFDRRRRALTWIAPPLSMPEA